MQGPSDEIDRDIRSGSEPRGNSGFARILAVLRRLTTPPSPGRGGHLSILWPLVTACLFGLCILSIPRHPYVLDDSLSEKAVLSFAHEHGLRFGKDIVFTYGPLGFLSSRYFFEHAAGLRTIGELVVCILASMGLCLLAWRLAPLWKWTLLGVGAFVLANVDPRLDLVLYTGLVCWGLSCISEAGWRRVASMVAFCLVAIFAMLTKADLLVIAGLCTAAIAVVFLSQRKFKDACILILSVGAGFLAGWVVAGQRVADLWPFLTNAVSIMRGYDQTVGLDGLEMLQRRGVQATLFALGAVLMRGLAMRPGNGEIRWLWRAGLTSWWIALVFLVWKHGFVRADLFHAGFCFGFLPIFVLALESVASRGGLINMLGRIFSLACCAVSLLTLQELFFSTLAGSLSQPFYSIAANVRSLCFPANYRAGQIRELEETRQFADLPKIREHIGRSSIDVFGQEQSYAILNRMNYRPRPVFQSYLAFNSQLMELNQRFYLSQGVPDYVLFHLAPIDHKFPPLEDAFLLRHLLINYEPMESEQQFVLLKKKSANVPKLMQLGEGTANLGERIELKGYGEANLWIEIEARPNWRGLIREMVSKPSKLRLAAWGKKPGERLVRSWAPAPMLSAGFVASPLLLKNADLINAASGRDVVRPDAYSLESDPGGANEWLRAIHYRVYRIESEISGSK
jgi:hypothetical protein